MELRVVARVESSITARGTGPLQGDEGSPPARLIVDPRYADAAADLRPGDDVWLLTWLHQADRSIQRVHPRGDPGAPLTGVFSTRSPDRPNPVGLHRVTVTGVEAVGDGSDGVTVHVRDLEAIDGTPVIDLKPVLPGGR